MLSIAGKIKNFFNSKLIKHSLVFISTDIINRAIPLLLLPILTVYLTPQDYGAIASFNSLVSVLGIIIGLSVHGAVNVNYYKLEKEELKVFIGNVILILISSALIASLVIFIFRHEIENYLKLPWRWFFIAVFLSVSSFIVTINLTLWIAEQKPLKYGLYKFFDTILKVSLSLWFVVVLLMNWEGRVLAIMTATIIMTSVSIIFLFKRGYLRFKFDINHIKDALNFGIPLIPHQFSGWVKTGAVVIILVNIIGQSETGLYDVGFKVAAIISFVTVAINKAYQPYLFRKLKTVLSLNEKIKITRQAYIYMLALLAFAGALTLASQFLINIFLDKKFADAYIYVGYISFAFAFQGMYFMTAGYIFFEKKTKYLAYITFIVSILHILVAYFLIKYNGAIGAAQASTISYFISFVLVWYYSNRVYPMPWFKSKNNEQ